MSCAIAERSGATPSGTSEAKTDTTTSAPRKSVPAATAVIRRRVTPTERRAEPMNATAQYPNTITKYAATASDSTGCTAPGASR